MLQPSEIVADYIIRDLDLIILALAKRSETWAYKIRQEIGRHTDVYVSYSTIADHILCLENYGYIKLTRQGRRKILTVTLEGEKYMNIYSKRRDQVQEFIDSLMATKTKE